MSRRCLALGDKGKPYPLMYQLWDTMLWYYVEEDVTDFAIERPGRVSDMVQHLIDRANKRYPALRYIYLEPRADIKAEIAKSEFLIIYPERSVRMKQFLAYAQQRQAEGLIEVTMLEGE